jgi:predicted ATPase/DNA-binding XRE family transcriptional regulator
MAGGAPRPFGTQLKTLRETAGFTQEELATIAGLSVHAISALERGERRRPHVETARALSAALDLSGAARDAFLGTARAFAHANGDDLNSTPLPLPLTGLLGRHDELRTLTRWLANPAVRLITLTGPGGAGKTRLAVELARTIVTTGTTHVTFVPLAAIRDPAFVASAIAEALGLTNATALDLPRRARLACEHHPTLMLLDNFEHVLGAAPLVADLLTSVSTLRLLVTSRAALHVRGEREYAVGPLALQVDSETLSPADLARCPAVRLFVERARDMRPDFRLTSANGRIIIGICRRLDALPLALELAAPWIKVLTADGLLRRLENDVLLASIGTRDLPERQQTMNATVAWSYQLLDADEQRAFRRFGALPALFSIGPAAAVLAGATDTSDRTDEAFRATAALIDKSLLLRAETAAGSGTRYQMLETVRACAVLELTAAAERDDALEGLARYCTREASRAAQGLVGPAQVDWLNRVREDLAIYRAALTWLLERGRPAEAADIALDLYFYWLIRGHAAEALGWYERVLSLPFLPPGVEARALLGAALVRHTKGDNGRARSALTRVLELARTTGDVAVVVQAEHVAGHLEHAVGNLSAARDLLRRSVEAFQALARPWGVGVALSGLAGIAIATGDAGEAERLLDNATKVLCDAGPWFLMPVLYVRAILAVRRGDADEAIALVRENLTRIRELDDKFAFVYALIPLATAAVLKGDHAWAARILGVRDAVIERTGAEVADGPVRDLRDRAEQEARARLGPERWTRAYAAGRRTYIDSAQDLYRFVADRHQ